MLHSYEAGFEMILHRLVFSMSARGEIELATAGETIRPSRSPH